MHLLNEPSDFADEAFDGVLAAHHRHLRKVHGGVVRRARIPKGQVAVVTGGGTGHYPAFAGWVGPGLAHGAACGNIFASPSASQVYSVLKASESGGGLLVSFGNYAGDVLHFSMACDQLRGEGIDVRMVPITDDIASAPASNPEQRRGIAGDLLVLKTAGAAADLGHDLDAVERLALRANDRTRTLGVAFAGCTLPGADEPLFTVPEGHMSIGLGIHGEPGLQDMPMQSADQIAELLVERVLAEAPADDNHRVAVVFNGLGTVKYEELFVTYRRVAERLGEAGYEIVEPEVGEQCTSLDMAGVSLSVMFLDDELEQLWLAACDTPALRRGAVEPQDLVGDDDAADEELDIPDASQGSRALAARIAEALGDVHRTIAEHEKYLGDIDAIAGDGDHGIGMLRGARAADETAAQLLSQGAGASTLLSRAAAAWAERAGGTSGALWGAALTAVARNLSDTEPIPSTPIGDIAASGVQAILDLGGAQVGDKTMIDAAEPFRANIIGAGDDVRSAWEQAVSAARTGAEGTANIAARRGRSRTHAEASIGTPDPGAVSFVMVLDALTPHIAG